MTLHCVGRPQKTMVCPTGENLTPDGRPQKTMVCPTGENLTPDGRPQKTMVCSTGENLTPDGRPQKTMVCPTGENLTPDGRPQKTMVCPTGENLTPDGRPQKMMVCPTELLESGTRPRPLFCCGNQPSFDRIVLDIPDQFIQFSRRANPVIVGFILPECFSAAPEQAIRNSASSSLQPAHDIRHRDMRLPHYVHMVRHDRPGVKIVGVAGGRTVLESILDNSGNTGVAQPERSRTASVELLVANLKRDAPCVLRSEDFGRRRRRGPGETPSDKDNASVRKPVRKPAPITKHGRPQKTMVCPTGENLTPEGRPQKTMVCPTAIVLTKI